jgi:hypothetical protein
MDFTSKVRVFHTVCGFFFLKFFILTEANRHVDPNNRGKKLGGKNVYTSQRSGFLTASCKGPSPTLKKVVN